MKFSIAFNALLLSVIFISPNVTSNEYVNQQPSYKCDSRYVISAESFDKKNKGVNQIIYSDRYCIKESNSRNIVEKSSLPTRAEVRKMVHRYKEVYSTLEKTNEKVAFVDLFMHLASQQHHISFNDVFYKKDSLSVIITSSSSSNRGVSGYSLSLFQNDKIDKKTSIYYSKYLSKINNTTGSSDLLSMVNYVLEGSLKKSVKSSSLLISPMDMAYAQGGDGEQDDDLMEEWEE